MPNASVSTAVTANPGLFANVRAAEVRFCLAFPTSSLVSQRNQWIDLRRPPRGHVAGEQSDYSKHNRHTGKREWIGCGHTEQHFFHYARYCECARNANRETNERQ